MRQLTWETSGWAEVHVATPLPLFKHPFSSFLSSWLTGTNEHHVHKCKQLVLLSTLGIPVSVTPLGSAFTALRIRVFLEAAPKLFAEQEFPLVQKAWVTGSSPAQAVRGSLHL